MSPLVASGAQVRPSIGMTDPQGDGMHCLSTDGMSQWVPFIRQSHRHGHVLSGAIQSARSNVAWRGQLESRTQLCLAWR
jgi:hypothetical protein